MSMHAAPARASTVSRALARDKLGMLAVLAFILAVDRADDGGGRGDPDRVRGHRPDRHPGRVPRRGRGPGLVLPRVRGDERQIRNAGAFYAFASAGLGR